MRRNRYTAARTPLAAVLAVVVVLAGCGGDDESDVTTIDENDSSTESETGGEDSQIGGEPAAGGGDPIAGVDLSSLGAPPAAEPQTAVVSVDGDTSIIDGSVLGVGQCEVGSDAIAVRIGQSEAWFAFNATATEDAWSAGPSWQGSDDGPQHEGLTPGSVIAVDGQTVTYQGEIVVKNDPTDLDSWTRTVGSVTANCAAT